MDYITGATYRQDSRLPEPRSAKPDADSCRLSSTPRSFSRPLNKRRNFFSFREPFRQGFLHVELGLTAKLAARSHEASRGSETRCLLADQGEGDFVHPSTNAVGGPQESEGFIFRRGERTDC